MDSDDNLRRCIRLYVVLGLDSLPIRIESGGAMNKYKIVEYWNGLNEEVYQVHQRQYWFFWDSVDEKIPTAYRDGITAFKAYEFDTFEAAVEFMNKLIRRDKLKAEKAIEKKLKNKRVKMNEYPAQQENYK
jgi:hypothetical protein